ncbi:MAG TPA: hypothetical protein VHG28_24875 [Longimicrobiaceae bacterium]|nr:hypothetical protein [Longimicrobiaceae bacterium]
MTELRGLGVAGLVLCAAALGCARPQPEPKTETASAPARQSETRAAPAPAQDTQRLRPPARPMDGTPWVAPPGARITPALDSTPPARQQSARSGGWTAGITVRRWGGGVVTLRAVRTARNPEWDRVVFEFAEALPGYHVEYVDRPVRRCGSGHVAEVAGDGWLQVRLTPAQAHDEAGRVTIRERERKLGFPVLRELELTCDFEADVTWVLGVARPNRYRVLELTDPARLVVDLRH